MYLLAGNLATTTVKDAADPYVARMYLLSPVVPSLIILRPKAATSVARLVLPQYTNTSFFRHTQTGDDSRLRDPDIHLPCMLLSVSAGVHSET